MQVLVADRHPLYRDMLRGVVADALSAPAVLEARDYLEAEDVVRRTDGLALALVDVSLGGIEGLLRLLLLRPATAIVPVADRPDPELVRLALVCGATSCLSKSLERTQMAEVIRTGTVADSLRRPAIGNRLDVLTPRERMVLNAMMRGRSNKQIAHDLGITPTTVKVHVSSVLRKLRVHSRVEAIIALRGCCPEDGSSRP